MVGYDLSDRLLVATPLLTVPVTVESRFQGWDLCNDLLAQLRVQAAGAAVGDTLVVKVQHSLNHVTWLDLTPLTFTTVTGTTPMPFAETKSIGKGAGALAWGPWLRVVATPAGGTANFTVTDLRLLGS